MKRAGIKLLVVGLTALGLSAGVVAGMLVSRLPAAMSGTREQSLPTRAMPTPLVEELDLTQQQQEQMRTIWEGVRSRVQNLFSEAQDQQKQRDDEIVKLLNDDQKAKFEEIAKRFHDRDVKIKDDREKALADAVDATKRLLNPEQRKKYDEILKQRLGRVPTTGPVAAALGILDPDGIGDDWISGGAHD